ncbi:hypothetical protein FDT66_10740 [Polaribacter aestuariivivens]|uniref:Uncharacterized protein n=1 Tax=Polaribacter aestuariivivens TaxID=2304626 RepID=A0A5S3N2S0_9FLAO|nr:hypothetical protein [Polaribacter aestuariivivens]TMM29585.1 hypothetical protein FDT66_10740 [Polaribacter aestuariivivens]
MKNLIFVFAFLFSLNFIAQNNEVIKKQEPTSENFDTFTPEENGRPAQFLTRYLRRHTKG